MIFNYVLVALILIAGIVGLRIYTKRLTSDTKNKEEEEESEFVIDIPFLVLEVSKAISRTLRQHLEEDNLTREELFRKRKRTTVLRESLTKANYGDELAKRTILNHIKELLRDKKYAIDEDTINGIIQFNNPSKLSSTDKTEIVLYVYMREHRFAGLPKLMEEYHLTDPVIVDGEERYVITKKRMAEVYDDVMVNKNSSLSNVSLTFNDKIEILAQRIYEKYIGFGPADILYNTPVDEIDAGVSGIPKGGFTIHSELQDIPFSYDSLWIVYHGLNIQMECLSFETQEELIRVCDNIYKYDAPYVMSRSEGRVVSTMIDGSRIVVCRPPFAESYMFFLRKFDSTPSVKPAVLIKDKNINKVIPIVMMKWLIKGQRNIGITGAQGTGKSTWLKSVVRFIDSTLNIRLQELQFELNLRFTYPHKNIATFQETANISAQEGLNLQKKTNGAVNIIGEVANAIQASHIIQTAMVASLFAIFTHHAKTAKDFIEAISNNLLELGLYKDKKDAVAMTVKVLNIDCHWNNVKGDRYLERITEIVPVSENNYPTDKVSSENNPEMLSKLENYNDDNCRLAAMKEWIKTNADTREYYRRVTDPKQYEVVDLVKRFPIIKDGKEVGGIYKLTHDISDEAFRDICAKLRYEDEQQFKYELNMLKRISDGEDTEEIRIWTEQALS